MMRCKAHIVSIAGILPAVPQVIDPVMEFRHVFSDPQAKTVSDTRSVWRLKTREHLVNLMALSVSNATEQAGITPSHIDYVLISHVWPENILNTEISMLASNAQLRCPIVSINSGTNGGMAALELASTLLHNTTLNCIAVIAGCNYSHWFQEQDPARSLLSDGAACVILSRNAGIVVENCHTIGTQDYAALEFVPGNEMTTLSHVKYSPDAGQRIFSHYSQTIQQCCVQLCQHQHLDLNDIAAFHIYDPTEWVKNSVIAALGVSEKQVISIFPHYGSLGPAHNFFGLINMHHHGFSGKEWVISMGFSPANSATAILLHWQQIPCSIQHTT